MESNVTLKLALWLGGTDRVTGRHAQPIGRAADLDRQVVVHVRRVVDHLQEVGGRRRFGDSAYRWWRWSASPVMVRYWSDDLAVRIEQDLEVVVFGRGAVEDVLGTG